jgi:osmoprotectant transport system ATP-binding protein
VSSILEIRGLSCSLGARPVLRNVSLTVDEGETVVLLGRSGSGKTTLLKAVLGLVAPTGGEILFQGKPTTQWPLIDLRRRMGYVVQDSGLFPHWTVERNIALPPSLAGWEPAAISERVGVLLEAVGLDPGEFRGRYPRQLSGGQRQRVAIARALAADPPLLLLDEPFAALDPITRFDLQRQFLDLGRRLRKAALFVTHDVREALMMATRIALVADGALDVLAPPGDFLDARTPEARAFLASLEETWRPHERPPRL